MDADDTKVTTGTSGAQPTGRQADAVDIFAVQSIFPDAAAVFTAPLTSLADAAGSACIVLDTNALLVPYGIGAQTLSAVEATYQRLLREKRLAIPAQVAREFARNRVARLAELHQRLSRRRSQLQPFQQGTYPLLEGLAEYRRLREVEEQLDKLAVEYRGLLTSVIEHVQSWEWNDPVSLLYTRLFTADVIVDTAMTLEHVRQEHRRRFANKIPPGYKDEAKDDQGVGDLLIWLAVLAVGAMRKTSVIFVSGEEKADWWHRSENQQLYPRFELVDEFRRASDGHSFHIIKFSRLLELFGASTQVVAEIRQEEVAASDAAGHPEPQLRALQAERAVAAWLLDSGYTVSQVPLDTAYDFVIEGPQGRFAVDFVYSRSGAQISRRLRRRHYDRRAARIGLPLVLIVVAETRAALAQVDSAWQSLDPSVRLCTGLLTPDGRFQVVRSF